MISKELLSEVLNCTVTSFHLNDNEIKLYGSEIWDEASINIYELAYKCKEWAFNTSFIISSGLTPVLGISGDGWAEVFNSSTPLEGALFSCKQFTEHEAIFEACQWILDNKDK